MSKLYVRHADAEQRRCFGPLTEVFIVEAAYREISQAVLWFSRYEDDIEPYDADYLLVSGVPVLVRRYASQPASHYTISVNCERAREAGFHPLQVPHTLLEMMGLPKTRITWTNPELAEQA